MRILGLIPARGGSKGVPHKNIKLLCGKPLIKYTIEAAIKSSIFDEIFVSTDDQQIADIAINSGIPVPVLRPSELAKDSIPTLPVINHVIDYFKNHGKNFDAVFLLQPTSPLRTDRQIKEAVTIFKNNNFDSLISVLEVPDKFNPYYVYLQSDTGTIKPVIKELAIRRQDLPAAFYREGSIYLFKINTIKKYGNIYGECIGYYKLSAPSVNIDTLDDFNEAERLISKAMS